MSGTLFLISTPIGNLEDITLRALRLLREADLIAAEDTRRTARLLAHYAIKTPTISFHEHNTRSRLPQLLRRLAGGERLALVTDAGTPGLSDPGVELVRACLDHNIPVDPIPGASAPLTAVVASGLPMEPLTIFGFPPLRGTARKDWIAAIKAINHTVTFFEAPHRIQKTLADIRDALGDRPIVMARELTKIHQEFIRGSVGDVIGQMTVSKGEFTVVIGPEAPSKDRDIRVNDRDVVAEFGRITDVGSGGRRRAVVAVARKYGLTPKYVYRIIERSKGSSA